MPGMRKHLKPSRFAAGRDGVGRYRRMRQVSAEPVWGVEVLGGLSDCRRGMLLSKGDSILRFSDDFYTVSMASNSIFGFGGQGYRQAARTGSRARRRRSTRRFPVAAAQPSVRRQ